MSNKITCGTHGKQDTTYVCNHIVASLKDGEACGFVWNKADGDFQALCAACNDMTDEEFAERQADIISILCFGCFQDAAALNGIDLL